MPKKIKVKTKKPKDLDIALQYYNSGNLQQAEMICRQILQGQSNNAGGWHLLGLIAAQSGQYDKAIHYFSRAIHCNPFKHFYYYDLGLAFQSIGMVDEAMRNYKEALGLKPDYFEAYYNLGNLFANNNMIDEAIESYRKALSLKPDYAEMYNNLGLAFKEKGLLDEAIDHFKSALKLKPDYAEMYNNLGTVLVDKGMIDEAIENYKQALKLKADYNEAYNNLGVALREKGMIDEAIENFKKALILNPDFAMAYNNLAIAIEDKGMIDEAIEAYKKALILKPDNAEMHQNLGMTYLLARDFEKGWEEYEWRLKTFKAAPLTKPKWDGSSLVNKTILVYAEQGYGDSLQFVRYLPKLYDEFAAKKVLFILGKVLEQLFRDSDLKAEILDPEASIEDLEYDTNIHLLSLPRIFKTNLENIPFKGKRYLKANPEKVRWYRERYFSDRQNPPIPPLLRGGNTPLAPLNRGELCPPL